MKNVKLLVEYVRKTAQARWLLIHALVAPWGTVITTGILVNLDRSAPGVWAFWRYWGDIGVMSSAVSYGAAVYGCAVSGTEVIIRMVFYAIAKILEYQEKRKEERMRLEEERRQRQEEHERRLAEIRQRGQEERERQLAEIREEGMTEGREVGLMEGRVEGRRESIDLVLNNPELQQHPELHERIVKRVGRGDGRGRA